MRRRTMMMKTESAAQAIANGNYSLIKIDFSTQNLPVITSDRIWMVFKQMPPSVPDGIAVKLNLVVSIDSYLKETLGETEVFIAPVSIVTSKVTDSSTGYIVTSYYATINGVKDTLSKYLYYKSYGANKNLIYAINFN